MSTTLKDCKKHSPFLLENEGAYQAWRTRKLKIRQRLSPDHFFMLDRDGRLPPEMIERLRQQVDAHNFALFESAAEIDKTAFLGLNRQLGLRHIDSNLGADEDSVTSLQVVGAEDRRAQYIPYTNRALNWHTDGYYNPRERSINAFALYCVQQAARGGGNHLFDHEMMYILIRDQSPDLLAALMDPRLMTIPANLQGKRIIRPQESGAVFAPRQDGRHLTMRYTSRPHNIVWKSDQRSEKALNLVREILMDDDAVIDLRLQRNQGIICNNILHGRQAFHDRDDRPARLIYRARYYDSIDLEPASAGEQEK